MEAQILFHTKHMLGEGPTWDSENERFMWVDIVGKTLQSYDVKANHVHKWSFSEYVTTVVPINKEEVVLAMHNGVYIFNLISEELTPLANPIKNLNIRFNDGKCDANGRLWVGTMEVHGSANEGALYCVFPDGSVKEKVVPVTISNGIAWNTTNDMMYYIDTPTKKVAAYDFNVQTSKVAFRDYVVAIPDGQGAPDGMTIDEEGMLWVAHYGGWKVSRWDPQTGKQLDEVRVPCSNVTSCTFGGKDLNELFITTARQGLDEEELRKQPHAGGVFRVETKTRGVKAYSFR
ncbi:SMP-30/gluconolactonase/LRE family protein [Lederbergia lenta]|uniref:Regucalcin n=1 Tax=Lederbergia lenta TaxID=1467 RepID=A0A2X4WYA7_LEDLE|nr:SMP-30/gluconolactonase/LRE family protein [Lederbergia lenta]MEC2323431.1 SMP-30/gluconolactonase/LRE family protein [Lederbergia lenta]SQI63402.1 SMP-30/gluconolaconase/LRE-like region-containing protein [Lederbergia lenta]